MQKEMSILELILTQIKVNGILKRVGNFKSKWVFHFFIKSFLSTYKLFRTREKTFLPSMTVFL